MNKTNLKKRGWTATQITWFLGAPDWTTTNPMYRTAAPVCHYDDARVAAVEASAEFLQARMQGKCRREGAAKAVVTKRQMVQDYVDALEVAVPEMDEDELCRRACESYNDYNNRSDCYASPDSDPKFLERITVNYLRHRLSCYEEALDKITGKVGAAKAYLAVKDKVLDAISDTYPDLDDECIRQSDLAWEAALYQRR